MGTSYAEFVPAEASLEDLLYHAQRYGNTPERRETKELAREEIFKRGPESLRYFMERIHIKNLWIRILAVQVAEHIDAEEGVPVLLDFLDAEEEPQRRYAVYLLGYYDAPEQAGKIMPFLDEEKTAGSAMRTLGKWKIREAVTPISSFVTEGNERQRVAAVNALRDIGDKDAIPVLITAFDDPFFTVRNAAARAVTTFGVVAEKPLIAALDHATPVAKRQVVRTLAEIDSKKAHRYIMKLTKDDDPGVRMDAEQALARIMTEKAAKKSDRKLGVSFGLGFGF